MMADFLSMLLGNDEGGGGAPSSPLSVLTGGQASAPAIDIKPFLAPIMEAMAAEAQRAADPISRIGDPASAVLSTIGSGTPYAQNLAALDKGRSDAIRGGANMFLNVLGQERQLEQLKTEDRRHQERMALDRLKLAETVATREATIGIDKERLGLSREMEGRRLREEGARRDREGQLEERRRFEAAEKQAKDTLPKEQSQQLQRLLDEDKDYQSMIAGGLYLDAGKRLREHYLKLAPQYPKEVTAAIDGFGMLTSQMNRMRQILRETDYSDRMAGPTTREQLRVAHGHALNAIRKLGEMGVLTPGEIPIAERQIPNPTDRFTLRGKEGIEAGFTEVERVVNDAITRYAARTGMSEEQIRKLAGMGPKTSSKWSAEPPSEKTWATGPSGKRIFTTDRGKTWHNEDGSVFK